MCCRCFEPLFEQSNGRVVLDLCPSCAGCFVQQAELDRAVGTEGLTKAMLALGPACPMCRDPFLENPLLCGRCGAENWPILCPSCQGSMRHILLGEGVL